MKQQKLTKSLRQLDKEIYEAMIKRDYRSMLEATKLRVETKQMLRVYEN